jgi:predicted SAM-dependent methyltransferase
MTNKPPTRIIVGASDQHYPGWLQTHENQLDITRWDDWRTVAQPGTLTHILSEHVWEHLTIEEAQIAARHCFAMLSPGGRVRCAAPDGNFPNPEYQDTVKVGGPGPADHPAASHKVVHTWDTLTDVFGAAGFEVSLLEWCDDGGAFHATGWDEQDGFIYRSARFDHRNQAGLLGFVSLIVDAMKAPTFNES